MPRQAPIRRDARPGRVAHAHRQRGVAAVVAALWLAVAVAALGALDIGNVFMVRRQLQRSADLSASAGAQAIGGANACDAARTAAGAIATANGLPDGVLDAKPPASATMTVVCGRWDVPSAGSAPVFSTTGAPLNAVQVSIQQQVPFMFLGPARTVSASATAKAIDIGTFSLATGTVALSGGMLNNLLNSLLGTNLALGVLTYQGLATTQVKLGDLAAALGVGSVDALLNTTVSIQDLVQAMITAITANSTVSVDVASALATIKATVPKGLQVKLGDTATGHGLLAIGLENPQGALSSKISVLDALLVSAEIANTQSAINLGAALNLGALGAVSTKLAIIQPPVIAIGEAGVDANGNPRTSAHSAQVRLALSVSLLPSIDLGVLANISVLNLPLYIEVGDATAHLQTTQCTASRDTSSSTILTQTGVAGICIGGNAAANFTDSTTPLACSQQIDITSVQLLLSLVQIFVSVDSLNLQLNNPQSTPLTFDARAGNSDDYQSINTNGLGGATAGLLGQILTQLPGALHVRGKLLGLPFDLSTEPDSLISNLLAGVVNALSPVLTELDKLLVPLLQALGVQIGAATVHDIALTCGEAQLVN
ncbi:TadG family pilus assembly protein [Paraburkholderia jirisanensis]